MDEIFSQVPLGFLRPSACGPEGNREPLREASIWGELQSEVVTIFVINQAGDSESMVNPDDDRELRAGISYSEKEGSGWEASAWLGSKRHDAVSKEKELEVKAKELEEREKKLEEKEKKLEEREREKKLEENEKKLEEREREKKLEERERKLDERERAVKKKEKEIQEKEVKDGQNQGSLVKGERENSDDFPVSESTEKQLDTILGNRSSNCKSFEHHLPTMSWRKTAEA
ncbi:hypothetical protein HDU96_002253 [Phlyctochytrium bullatum]|nr:hypothetical protein HDU96_002253 [Phlyctochytrium bullatum]